MPGDLPSASILPCTAQLPGSGQVRLIHNEMLLICPTYFLQQTQPLSLSALRSQSGSFCLGSCHTSPLHSSGRWTLDLLARCHLICIPLPYWQGGVFFTFFQSKSGFYYSQKGKKKLQYDNFGLCILIAGKALKLSRQILPPIILMVIDCCERQKQTEIQR